MSNQIVEKVKLSRGKGAAPQKKVEELAACWKKTDKNGEDYLSVKLKLDERVFNFRMFKNRDKSSSTGTGTVCNTQNLCC